MWTRADLTRWRPGSVTALEEQRPELHGPAALVAAEVSRPVREPVGGTGLEELAAPLRVECQLAILDDRDLGPGVHVEVGVGPGLIGHEHEPDRVVVEEYALGDLAARRLGRGHASRERDEDDEDAEGDRSRHGFAPLHRDVHRLTTDRRRPRFLGRTTRAGLTTVGFGPMLAPGARARTPA